MKPLVYFDGSRVIGNIDAVNPVIKAHPSEVRVPKGAQGLVSDALIIAHHVGVVPCALGRIRGIGGHDLIHVLAFPTFTYGPDKPANRSLSFIPRDILGSQHAYAVIGPCGIHEQETRRQKNGPRRYHDESSRTRPPGRR